MNPRDSFHTLAFAVVILVSTAGSSDADTPLHEWIDMAVGVGSVGFDSVAADDAGDAAFARRIYLDLAGTIPSAEQVRQFIADRSSDKRARLIDQLLTSPQYARRMQYAFDTMLMERRPGKHIKTDEWRNYLRQSFAQNKPWDQLVTEMLTADGADEKTRPAARFLLDREMKTDAMTRDLSRIFLGRDLQCAQCHDHPNVEDYLQRHYHGLSAFLNRSYLFTDPKSKQASIGEKAEGAVKFTSVFTSESDETAPRLLDLPPIEDPPAAKEPYTVKPDKKVRSVPVYSRRLLLAVAMTDPANVAFRRNIANRLWALMMGRGIVEPLDMWHADNPPSHPALLDLLADALADHDYDMRYLLRELALTKIYQRSSQYKSGVESVADDHFSVALLKPLSPEQLAWSMMQATALTDATLKDLKAKHLAAGAQNASMQIEDPLWQEEALHNALKDHVETFAGLFGIVGIQTSRFDASANQALFLRNGTALQSWIASDGGQLTAHLDTLKPPQLVDEFYFSMFSRPPTAEEIQFVTLFLEQHQGDQEAAIRQLLWAALSSAEFRFNH
ncbi:MAG TPA: DUF1549 domain-containing protein [Planctomycetes bacterium]|nr:DUF1549 domain-containing protein [Planctomycetota bacterium]